MKRYCLFCTLKYLKLLDTLNISNIVNKSLPVNCLSLLKVLAALTTKTNGNYFVVYRQNNENQILEVVAICMRHLSETVSWMEQCHSSIWVNFGDCTWRV